MNDPDLRASSMSGPQYLKRWLEGLELRLKMRGIIRPGGAAVIQQNADTVVNMVTLMAEDMHQQGYLDQQEYLESDAEIVDAEVVDEDEGN